MHLARKPQEAQLGRTDYQSRREQTPRPLSDCQKWKSAPNRAGKPHVKKVQGVKITQQTRAWTKPAIKSSTWGASLLHLAQVFYNTSPKPSTYGSISYLHVHPLRDSNAHTRTKFLSQAIIVPTAARLGPSPQLHTISVLGV